MRKVFGCFLILVMFAAMVFGQDAASERANRSSKPVSGTEEVQAKAGADKQGRRARVLSKLSELIAAAETSGNANLKSHTLKRSAEMFWEADPDQSRVWFEQALHATDTIPQVVRRRDASPDWIGGNPRYQMRLEILTSALSRDSHLAARLAESLGSENFRSDATNRGPMSDDADERIQLLLEVAARLAVSLPERANDLVKTAQRLRRHPFSGDLLYTAVTERLNPTASEDGNNPRKSGFIPPDIESLLGTYPAALRLAGEKKSAGEDTPSRQAEWRAEMMGPIIDAGFERHEFWQALNAGNYGEALALSVRADGETRSRLESLVRCREAIAALDAGDFNAALVQIRLIPDLRQRAVVFTRIAALLREKDETERAAEAKDEAVQPILAADDSRGKAQALLSLAEANLPNDGARAVGLIRSAVEVINRLADRDEKSAESSAPLSDLERVILKLSHDDFHLSWQLAQEIREIGDQVHLKLAICAAALDHA